MKFHSAHIDNAVINYFNKIKNELCDLDSANHYLYDQSGIIAFFNTENELKDFLQTIEEYEYMAEEYNQLEYGDFQTNMELTDQLCNDLSKDSLLPEFVLEPTCGKGNFIVSSLKHLPQLRRVVGIEFYESYVWEAKFNILQASLEYDLPGKPDIEIIHTNVFEYPFQKLSQETKNLKTLVLGNPPWVTNAKLSTLNSDNLPNKTNFKKQKGLDAITGKSNFDIGEYIALLVLRHFSDHEGVFAFLIKNSIVRNLVYAQKSNMFNIDNIERLNIDAKKEFNVNVSASVFKCDFNSSPSLVCQDKNFYKNLTKSTFGWQKDKFVYSIEDYGETNNLDNVSPFVWRQGVKHDSTKVMELSPSGDNLVNGLNEHINPEEDLLYGILKSSDLKGGVKRNYRKLTIITQKKIGQETNYIREKYPKTYHYLKKHKAYFEKRKSRIYQGKPAFSIFGIGDYSFKRYKVAISGLYKTTFFTLVAPDENKPIMLDDTCYFVGFDSFTDALITYILLNHEITQKFLKSIIFPDFKRGITKEILMRIDLANVYRKISFEHVKSKYPEVSHREWTNYGKALLTANPEHQYTLFQKN